VVGSSASLRASKMRRSLSTESAEASVDRLSKQIKQLSDTKDVSMPKPPKEISIRPA
jgi:hypothetical protein